MISKQNGHGNASLLSAENILCAYLCKKKIEQFEIAKYIGLANTME